MDTTLETKDTLKENTDQNSPEKLCKERPWTSMFPPEMVKQAMQTDVQSRIRKFEVQSYYYGTSARYYPDLAELRAAGVTVRKSDSRKCGYTHSYGTRYRYYHQANAFGLYTDYDNDDALYYEVSVRNYPRYLSDAWSQKDLSCSCKRGKAGKLCEHEAALLAYWTRQRGGKYMVTESENDYQQRQQKIKTRRKNEELNRLKKQYGTNRVPALDFFKDKKDPASLYIYDMRTALQSRQTDPYSIHMAKEYLEKTVQPDVQFHEFTDERTGEKTLDADLNLTDNITNERFWAAEAEITGSELYLRGSDGYLDYSHRLGSYWASHGEDFEDCGEYLNISCLILCAMLWEATVIKNQETGDLTDSNADKFFQSLEKENVATIEKTELPEEARKKNVTLYPRIITESGVSELSFRIEQAGAKVMVVKNMRELVGCYTDRSTYVLSKTTSIDFSKVDFTQESAGLFQFIQRRIGEVHDANMKIESRNSFQSVRTLTVTSALDLKGALLDGFYDTWEGHACEYTDKSNNIKGVTIRVGHRDLRFALTADKITDARGTFAGVEVHGLVPVLIHGSGTNYYVLNSAGLSRITLEERRRLQPFRSIADNSGFFRFQVGREHLQEFYYRVVPTLLDNPSVQFKDKTEQEAQQYLPPEPQFDFYLDCVDLTDPAKLAQYPARVRDDFEKAQSRKKDVCYLLTIRGVVSYEDSSKTGTPQTEEGGSGQTYKQGTAQSTTQAAAQASTRSITQAAAQASTRSITRAAAQSSSQSLTQAGTRDSAQNTTQAAISNSTGQAATQAQPSGIAPAAARETSASGIRHFTLGSKYGNNTGYHDTVQEERVEKAITNLAPQRYGWLRAYAAYLTDEEMFDFLRSGIALLERYGTVHGTDAFRTHAVRPVPQVKIGVSVDSSVMDLTLTSQDLSEEELLAVMQSYRLRKRYHKLSSGDYLDLTQDNQLSEVGDLLAGLDLSPEEVIEKSARIPLYRALYLDHLLEAHEDIATSRDRVYRGLIRNFKTVRDSEIEPPAALESVLRPYQQFGFKWMKTLEKAGFGGILADEMGLGKTLQMISVLLSDYETQATLEENKDAAEKLDPSLIVCPASLVYNWQEEFEKFAPSLTIRPLAGGAAARKKAWEDWEKTQVYIISYDLLKRHIAEIAQKSFYYVVLDEAQYVKNAGASAAKSVKALKATHRFALTGTPIENRLSELWSIFDFLMPGFLFSHTEFTRRLEVPITKQKDEEATQKLRNMTGPFILRRRKEDVLKDLPPKLEEVRYVPISGEQQKLYDAQVLKVKGAIKDSEASEGGSKIQIFAELTRIREICCDPSLIYENYHGESAKRAACLALIQQAMDGGHRMLVFSQFTSMLALLEKDLQGAGIPYYLLTGATSKEKRIQLVHDFNEGDTPVFLISLKAGGTGLNLTGADVVIHYDPWWNLAAQNQATDRTHRIGQTRQVTVYKLILKGTIEDRILELQQSKKDLAESVLEGDSRSLSSLTSEELLELLE